MEKSQLSSKAQNSLNLYKGQNPSKIKMLLKMQSNSVVNELKEYCNATDIEELSIKLSMQY